MLSVNSFELKDGMCMLYLFNTIPGILIETVLCFSWLNPLPDLGQKQMLEEDDMDTIFLRIRLKP